MNFQIVEQNNGNLVQMFGVFTDIGGLQYTPQRKAKAICKIRDDTNVEHTVHIYQGKGQLPGPEHFNQRCQFTLSTFQGNYQGKSYTGYSGFWNSDAQINQQPRNIEPNQRTSVPQQTTSPIAKKEVDWDAKDRQNARMNGLNNATSMLTTLATILDDTGHLTTEQIKITAECLVNYVYNGIDWRVQTEPGAPRPEEVDAEPAPTDNNTPF